MTDTLVDSEILDIWKRIRDYLDLSKVTATDKMNTKEQLRNAMENPVQRSEKYPVNLDTLVDNGFPSAFVENEDVKKDLIGERISELKIKGTTRYTIKGGTISSSGNIRGGRFLRGKTRDQALDDFINKLSFTKKDDAK